MKILFLASDLNQTGGIQRYNKNLLRAISESGEEVFLIEFKNGLTEKISFVFKLFIKVLQLKPDIIICSHINLAPIGYFLKVFLGKKYLVITHGIEVWNLSKGIKNKSLKNAKIVITVSNYTKEKLIQQIPEIREKIFLLSNTINGQLFYPKEKSDNLMQKYNLSGAKVILTVTRLVKSEKYKGYDKVIKALSLVIKEISDIKYLIVGKGDDSDRMRCLIKDMDLENNIIMIGYVSDNELLSYYNTCDIFIMPSKIEGFGIVFLEALACGKPVIAGNKDGSKDALLDGELGILINPDNINDIAEAIIKVLKGEIPKELLDKQFLRKRILEVYGFDKFKDRVDNLLYELQK